jgi:molybdopterin molybdotransferase
MAHPPCEDAAPVLSIDDARAMVLESVTPLGTEEVPVDRALNRVLAEDVTAAADVPGFDNSAMDGFIVTPGGAGRRLTIVGESRAGAPATESPREGEAVRVSTGALVPEGRGGVIPVEQVDERDGEIETRAETAEGQHVRRAGEDVRAGQRVLEIGARLGAAELGIAVVAGRATLTAALTPRVAILATGDELRPPGAELGPGQIHESNGITLGALAHSAHALVALHNVVADDPEATRQAIKGALHAADVLILSGGVSVGPHDHVKPALDEQGVTERFWRVALRPGKPTWFGTKDDKLVFGLPGNPVSAMVTFLLFVRPALARLQGADPAITRIPATLTQPVPRNPGRDEAVRVSLDTERNATPTGPQGSHQLSSMLNADGLALVTAGQGEAAAGETVTVELI